jgi:hypothetical protein
MEAQPVFEFLRKAERVSETFARARRTELKVRGTNDESCLDTLKNCIIAVKTNNEREDPLNPSFSNLHLATGRSKRP